MGEETELGPNQTLVEHLTELKKRIVRVLLGITVGFGVAWTYSEVLFDIARKPILEFLPQGGLVFTAPIDKFMAHLKVSLLASVIISSPFWLYQLWRFISPGLYKNERLFGTIFILSGTILFLSGVSFVYFIIFPLAFKFLMTFGGGTDKPMITISEYLSFFTTVTIVFGAVFQMPLVLSMLGRFGIIDKSFLKKYRRYAIVLLAILSAIFTPPDVMSQLLMMGPMLFLYELSVILVGILGKKPEEVEKKPD